MTLTRQLTLGFKSLKLHKLRSALTMLGVVIGVANFIGSLSVGEGAKREQVDSIQRMGANKILVKSVRPSSEEQSRGAGNSLEASYGLTYRDQDRIDSTLPSVVRSVGIRVFDQRDIRFGNDMHAMRVAATIPTWFEAINQPLLAGRPFLNDEEAEAARVCVLSENAARRLLFAHHATGESITIDGETYTVVGIVERGGLAGSRDEEFDVIIPLSTSIDALGETISIIFPGGRMSERVEYHQIIVEVDDTDNVEETANAIGYVLDRFHDDADYAIDVPLELLRQKEATQRRFAILLGSIAIIALIVGGIGIMNIMLASVTERTREIGIRRAIGARRGQIIRQFLIETVMLSFTGGIIGVVLGFILPVFVERLFQFPVWTPMYAVYISLGISVLVGVCAGLYPAVRAANLDPITALRHE